MNKPTLGEYKIALDNIECCKQSLNLVLEKKNKLLDELLRERENEILYKSVIEESRKIKDLYEIYEGIEKEN